MREELPLIFKIARESQGLTQQDVARLGRVDRSTLAHFEAGRPQIDVRSLVRIAPLLSINPDFVTGEHRNPFRSGRLIRVLLRGQFRLDMSLFEILIRHNKSLEFVSLIPHHSAVARIDRFFQPDAVYAVLARDDLQNVFLIRNRSKGIVLIKQYESSLEEKLSRLAEKGGGSKMTFRTVELRDPALYDLIRNRWDETRREDVMRFFRVDAQRETKIADALEYLSGKRFTDLEMDLLSKRYKIRLSEERS